MSYTFVSMTSVRYPLSLLLPLCFIALLVPPMPFGISLPGSLTSFALLFSNSASWPGLLVMMLVPLVLVARAFALPPRQIALLFGILVALLLLDLGIKTLLKAMVSEPRPYVLWLQQHANVAGMDRFYQRPDTARLTLLMAAQINLAIPDPLLQHWAYGVNYAFPSGHLLVAITLSLFFGLIWPSNTPGRILLILWLLAVALSRLLLGMHWGIDLLGSALLAGIPAWLAACWVKKHLLQEAAE
ncbi:phosphatidylglycerophosphatase B [Aeromonas sp. RU39B]|nr:phosphatidylglycerophosphatase B [Aeromonas sp. RU39B]